MNALLWRLPAWLHSIILWLTGYRLIRYTYRRRATEYQWSRRFGRLPDAKISITFVED